MMNGFDIFQFLKNLFGFADQRTRKRKANDNISISNEITSSKKYRSSNNNSDHLKSILIDIDSKDDGDCIEVITESKRSASSSYRSNGTHTNHEVPHYTFSSAPSFTSVIPKYSAPRTSHNRLNMGYAVSRTHKTSTPIADRKCQTLSKTQELREKGQYKALLDNFYPRRIDIISDKSDEPEVQEIPPVVELDKPEVSSTSTKSSRRLRMPEISRGFVGWSSDTKRVGESSTEKTSSLFSMRSGRIPPNRKDESSILKPLENLRIETIPVRNLSETKKPSVLDDQQVTSNSLRDTLATKSVTSSDYIQQITKRYNERIKRRTEEVEALQKLTNALSKNNRLTREVALKEQLTRSMRLCEAVIDETEEPEELPLPTLTNEMQEKIRLALIPRPMDEVLVESFGLKVTRKDMHTLANLNWLNDEVINFYMNLLISRSSADKYPNIHAMNTFFYPKLVSSGHSSLKRWTRKIDIFNQDIVVVPIHLGMHWCMSIIDFRNKTIKYYDSMGGGNPKCLAALKQYLEEESLDKKKKSYDTNDWKLENARNIPQQTNCSDCGVFSCMFAEYICANKNINFTQESMPYFRNKMVYEILNRKLL